MEQFAKWRLYDIYIQIEARDSRRVAVVTA